MRRLIYSIGVTLFLSFLVFHVTTLLTNPFYGMSVEALAQGSGSNGATIVCPPAGIDEGQCHIEICDYYVGPPFFIPIRIVVECIYTGSTLDWCVLRAPC